MDAYDRPYAHYVDWKNQGGRWQRQTRIMRERMRGTTICPASADPEHLGAAIDIGDVAWLKKSGATFYDVHRKRWSRNWTWVGQQLTVRFPRRISRSSVRGARR